MTVTVMCPHCGFSSEVPKERVPPEGTGATCRCCNQKFEISAKTVIVPKSAEVGAPAEPAVHVQERPEGFAKRIFKLVVSAALVFIILLSAVYLVLSSSDMLPKSVRYEIDDWFTRLTAPNFILPIDRFSDRDQADIIGELQRRDFKMKCYGSLRPEEKIGKNDDHACWFVIKSAYDNIPAKSALITFQNGRLAFVKLEFPESAFTDLNAYLNKTLAIYPRIEHTPSFAGATDGYGKGLKVWRVAHGVVATSAEPTKGVTSVVLWEANP